MMRDFSRFSEDDFNTEFLQVNWELMLSRQQNVNCAFSTLYNKPNKLINKHAPVKSVSRCKFKQFCKPWITKGLRKSIKMKNPLFTSSDNKKFTQTRRRRQRERHLKMWLRVSAIISQFFKVTMLTKCVLTILELNWNQRFRAKKTKFNICHTDMLTLSTQLQNRSFHVVERTRTAAKCPQIKTARAKRAKLLFFIVKYANLWRTCWSRRRGCVSSLMKSINSIETTF